MEAAEGKVEKGEGRVRGKRKEMERSVFRFQNPQLREKRELQKKKNCHCHQWRQWQMVRCFTVIYKSQSGNKIRLSGSVEMDLLNITINYVAVKSKDDLFSWPREKSCHR